MVVTEKKADVAQDPQAIFARWRSDDYWKKLGESSLISESPWLLSAMSKQIKFWVDRPLIAQTDLVRSHEVSSYVMEEEAEQDEAWSLVQKAMVDTGISLDDENTARRLVDFFQESADMLVYLLIYPGFYSESSGVWQQAKSFALQKAAKAENALKANASLLQKLGVGTPQDVVEAVIGEKNGGNHLPPFYLPVPPGTSKNATIDIYEAGRRRVKVVREKSKITPAPREGIMKDYPRKNGALSNVLYNNRLYGMTRTTHLFASANGAVKRHKPQLVDDPMRQVVIHELEGFLRDYGVRLVEDGFSDPYKHLMWYVGRYMPQYAGIIGELLTV